MNIVGVKKMANDRAIGALLLLGSITLLVIYFWLLLTPTLSWYAFAIVSTAAVVGVLGIIGWIGWTLATTPPPPPIEETPPPTTETGEKAESEKEQAEPGKEAESEKK